MSDHPLSPENQAVLNKHGIVQTNGAVVLTMVTLARMLGYTRSQGRTARVLNKENP